MKRNRKSLATFLQFVTILCRLLAKKENLPIYFVHLTKLSLTCFCLDWSIGISVFSNFFLLSYKGFSKRHDYFQYHIQIWFLQIFIIRQPHFSTYNAIIASVVPAVSILQVKKKKKWGWHFKFLSQVIYALHI